MFKDTKDHWARDDIDRATRLGLLRGYPDGTFRPDDPIKRAEAAAIALRLYDMAEDTFEDIAAQVEQAVVTVSNLETGAIGSGSSIGNGFVLTNAHVVMNPKGKTSWHYGIQWVGWGYGEAKSTYAEGPCVFVDPVVDLAIVRVDIVQYRKEMPSLPLGDPASVRRGMPVLVIGSPVGLAGTMTQGIVSFVGRQLDYTQEDGTEVKISDGIQVDAPINPGNSGGALVNRQGELIGVPSLKLSHVALEGLGFCIGLGTVRDAIRRADESGALATAHKADLLTALKDQGLVVV